jgi:hypothetical protein
MELDKPENALSRETPKRTQNRSMSEEEINKAIAEEVGYFYMDDHWHYPNGAKIPHGDIPDLNDLNAMREALSTLKEDQWDRFESELGWITGDRGFCKINATAKQKAEAFLKTVGKWKEKK